MAPTTPTGEPSEIVAGDSIRWRVADHTDYPQFEGWTLKYELVDVNTQSITAVWQTSGDDNGKLTRKIFVLSAWIGLKDQMRAVIRYLIPELWRARCKKYKTKCALALPLQSRVVLSTSIGEGGIDCSTLILAKI